MARLLLGADERNAGKVGLGCAAPCSVLILRRLPMKASEGQLGRVFVIRLEDGDAIPACIESFAEEKKISVGQVILIGGIGDGQVVVGPRHSDEMPPEPMLVP